MRANALADATRRSREPEHAHSNRDRVATRTGTVASADGSVTLVASVPESLPDRVLGDSEPGTEEGSRTAAAIPGTTLSAPHESRAYRSSEFPGIPSGPAFPTGPPVVATP